MRVAPVSINNEYYDEDYLRVFTFPKMGKNVKVHRSVVFEKPGDVSIGDNVTIMPFCVIGDGKVEIKDGTVVKPFTYIEGIQPVEEKPLTTAERKRLQELEEKFKDDGKPSTTK